MKTPIFATDGANTYRTKEFIVKQILCVRLDEKQGNVVVSYDTFYKRTKRRDAEYEAYFETRRKIDGTRLPSMMYTRRYVE